MPATAVVIPFFARGPAVLARTVRSVLDQRDVTTPLVIVVDDGSPHPARTELAALTEAERAHVFLVEQPNGGPAAARNAGLNAVPDGTDWVALLDADDTWTPDHLATAIGALEQGFDFYFTNHQRKNVALTHFGQCGFDPTCHPRLPGGDTLHAFAGDFFTRSLNGTPVGTSTIVYRWSELSDIRFPLFPWAWEDLMFWLDVATRTKRVAFNAVVKVVYDPGGIAGVGSWRSPAELQRKLWYIQHFTNVRRRFRLTSEQSDIVYNSLRRHAEGFAITTLALLRHGQLPSRHVLVEFVRWYPQVIPTLCCVAARQLPRLVPRLIPR